MVRDADKPAHRRKPKTAAPAKAPRKKRKPKSPPKAKAKLIGRPRKDGTAEIVAREERLHEALQLCKAGYSQRQIGQWLEPPCSAAEARRLIMEALAEVRADTAELADHLRTIELARLDDMTVKVFEAAKMGDTRAIAAVLSIMERRAQIVGIDAPKRQEHSGPDGGPIPFARIERVIVDPHPNTAHPDGAGVPTTSEPGAILGPVGRTGER